jgi:hypothetical protein
MSEKAIGKCSLCGGVVTMHYGLWMSIIPPAPTCSSCGATKSDVPENIIPMANPTNKAFTSVEQVEKEYFPKAHQKKLDDLKQEQENNHE